MLKEMVKLVPALERGTNIIDLITRSPTPLTISEIARELGMAKSSVSTICNTLVHLELLVKRPDQGFQLGPHVMRWANAFSAQSDVVSEFSAIWDRESELPGATITLSVLDETDIVYIATRDSGFSASLFDFRVGMRLPAAFTASGKAFLSYKSDIEIRKLYSTAFPEPMTPNSVRSVEQLLLELKSVREAGYSCDEEQVSEGITCYGACVLNANNRPAAGIAVSILSEKMSNEQTMEIVGSVQRIATEISRRMGADITLMGS